MSALSDRVAERTLELVNIPSESRHEDEIREHVLRLVPPALSVEYSHDDAFLFLPERRSGAPLVVLAGHYDTVPAQENLPGRLDRGAVHGLGASDMKGGVAVAIELVRDLGARPRGPYDVALLLFGREELPPEHNPLPALFDGSSAIHDAALAILLEPTDGEVHAGCLGHMSARLSFRGVSGHSARPWQSDNAIERAIDGLAPVLAHEPRAAVVGGLTFKEVLSVTRFEAGIADNVIPDLAVATVSFRYAPDRTPASARSYLQELVGGRAEIEITGDSPPGDVVVSNPLVGALVEAGARGIEPKQAWTNVADFTARGIDAVNFGPGHTERAHRRDELVEISGLVHAYETLWEFLTGAVGEDGR
ncbi:MAG: succinyl-diaminopimelate desuccinylase [Actinomycetota bacterium]|nr:succinyl-diaminopimelate desuccinylase [Actinomycetota bacterium]